jgi:hypothetical protein
MLAHLRTDAYPVYGVHGYPPRELMQAGLSYEENLKRIAKRKSEL